MIMSIIYKTDIDTTGIIYKNSDINLIPKNVDEKDIHFVNIDLETLYKIVTSTYEEVQKILNNFI